MNLHPWLNAVHIIAAIIWIGGILVMAVVASWCQHRVNQQAAIPTELLSFVRQWSRKITSPAMVLLWLVGIAMVIIHGKMPHLWLVLKILLVVGLSGIHGVLTATLRRLATGTTTRIPAIIGHASAIVLLLVTLIILLAIIRPF
ncbi:CopD family protein [Phytobacter sp. V91]|uniref:CopD family protein n=1 Tax=Phytobacter sp. V91 TaxID=3369425 RepID=UPI003F62AEB5